MGKNAGLLTAITSGSDEVIYFLPVKTQPARAFIVTIL